MPTEIKGKLDGKGLNVAIVVARFNSFITDGLKQGAVKGLEEHGVDSGNITVYYCPGAFEIPAVARTCVEKGDADAVICLGAVIQGETDHYQYVCDGATRGVGELSAKSEIPVIYGVLTCQNIELARARAGDNQSNKGYETALAALEMVNLLKQMKL